MRRAGKSDYMRLGAVVHSRLRVIRCGRSGVEAVGDPTRPSVRWASVKDVPIEELPVIDVDVLRRGDRPTADDVTILRDGTRLDTPEKVVAYVEWFKAELAAGDRLLGGDRGA